MSIGVGTVRRLLSGTWVAVAVAGSVVSAPGAHAEVISCANGWQADTLASGLGALENLEADGGGGFYLTGIVNGLLYHVDSSGTATTLLSGLDHPAGLRLIGDELYFLTGNNDLAVPGTGTLQRYTVSSGAVTTLLTGLWYPNGLLLLPDGDLIISDLSIPVPAGLGRYRPSTGEFDPHWSNTPYPNGIALAADGRSIYTENDGLSQVVSIPLDAPATSTVIATIHDGLFPGLDDMEATRSGQLYLAGDTTGSIYQVDPATGASCTIATGWQAATPIPPTGPTSVRIANDGVGWALYVTGVDGTLRRLRPPAGVDLTPVFADTDG
ncbi:SMP-30/gluconolactonase/LRE family protein [Nocardia sp. NPDC004582]